MAASSEECSDEDCSANLFTNDDGSSMEFVFPAAEDNEELQRLIENGGGIVSKECTAQSIRLSHEDNPEVNTVSIKFIYESLRQNEALDIEEYRIKDPSTELAKEAEAVEPLSKVGDTKLPTTDDVTKALRIVLEPASVLPSSAKTSPKMGNTKSPTTDDVTKALRIVLEPASVLLSSTKTSPKLANSTRSQAEVSSGGTTCSAISEDAQEKVTMSTRRSQRLLKDAPETATAPLRKSKRKLKNSQETATEPTIPRIQCSQEITVEPTMIPDSQVELLRTVAETVRRSPRRLQVSQEIATETVRRSPRRLQVTANESVGGSPRKWECSFCKPHISQKTAAQSTMQKNSEETDAEPTTQKNSQETVAEPTMVQETQEAETETSRRSNRKRKNSEEVEAAEPTMQENSEETATEPTMMKETQETATEAVSRSPRKDLVTQETAETETVIRSPRRCMLQDSKETISEMHRRSPRIQEASSSEGSNSSETTSTESKRSEVADAPIRKSRRILQKSTLSYKETINFLRKVYTANDDLAIIRYIKQHPTMHQGGNEIWRAMERDKITEHTWQSMRSRYLKTLCKTTLCSDIVEDHDKQNKSSGSDEGQTFRCPRLPQVQIQPAEPDTEIRLTRRLNRAPPAADHESEEQQPVRTKKRKLLSKRGNTLENPWNSLTSDTGQLENATGTDEQGVDQDTLQKLKMCMNLYTVTKAVEKVRKNNKNITVAEALKSVCDASLENIQNS